jgi:hypothetical protein
MREVHDPVHGNSWDCSKQRTRLFSDQEVSEGSENSQSECLFVEDRNRGSGLSTVEMWRRK